MSRRIHGGKARGILVAVAVAAGVAWSAQAAGAAPTQVPCYQDGGSLSCPSLAPGPTVTKTVTKTAAPTVTKTVTKTKTVTASASPSAVPTSATPSTPVPGVGEDACTDPNLTPVPVPADGLVPSQVLDLNPWYEGVPVETPHDGTPDQIEQPELAKYESKWFFTANGGVTFVSCASGAHTGGSHYPRSELREMVPGYSSESDNDDANFADWDNAGAAVHTMDLRESIDRVDSVGKPELVFAQIHGGSDDLMQAKYEAGQLKIVWSDGNQKLTIDPAYVLGTQFDLQLVATNGGVQVYYNGVRVDKGMLSAVRDPHNYFKAGAYLQFATNYDRSPNTKADDLGQVTIYSAKVRHEPGPKPSSTPTPSPTPSPSPTPTPTPEPTTEPPTSEAPAPAAPQPAAPSALKRIPEDATSGPGWEYDNRGWVNINGDGAVFSGYSVKASVHVGAPNVTISGNDIQVSGPDVYAIAYRKDGGYGAENLTIRGNSIHGPSGSQPCDNAIRDINGNIDKVTILDNDIYFCMSGINHIDGGGLIRGNNIHDIGDTDGCAGQNADCGHWNGIQLGSGYGPMMTIDSNTILIPAQATDAIMLANDDGPQANRTITNNLLGGGGYTFYGSGGEGKPATGIVFTGNQFTTRYFPLSGYFGPVAHWPSGQAGNVFAGNTWADGPQAGQIVTP